MWHQYGWPSVAISNSLIMYSMFLIYFQSNEIYSTFFLNIFSQIPKCIQSHVEIRTLINVEKYIQYIVEKHIQFDPKLYSIQPRQYSISIVTNLGRHEAISNVEGSLAIAMKANSL